MREFDAALKKALMHRGGRWFRMLTGCKTLRWMNVDLQKSRGLRADLLARAPNGRIFHFELQSANDPLIWIRMLEYAVAIYRKYGAWPVQFVLYVGPGPMTMASPVETEDLRFRFQVVDVRMLETEPFLRSPGIGDNVMALLTRAGEDPKTVRRILARVARGAAAARREAIDELMVLSGLRQVSATIEEEAKTMPLLDDLYDHPFFGPRLKAARKEAALDILLDQAEARFGGLDAGVRQRLSKLSARAIRQAARRMLDASRPEDLFPQTARRA